MAVRKTLGTVALLLAFVSFTFAQQVAPKDVLPATPQKPPVSPTVAPVAPAAVDQPSVNPTTVTPLVPAAPQEFKPDAPQTAPALTNVVDATKAGQPLSLNPANSSAWDRANAATSAWDKATSTAKPTKDLWSTPPAKTTSWDSTTPVSGSGTKTDWK